MIQRVILLSGPISCGKSTLAKGLRSLSNAEIFRTREILGDLVKQRFSSDRLALQRAGDRLDKSTGGIWVVEKLEEWIRKSSLVSDVIVDSVRIPAQIEAIRKAFGKKVIHVHLTAPPQELEKRYKRRHRGSKGHAYSYTEARKNSTERKVDSLRDIADVVIDTKRCTPHDVQVRVACHIDKRIGKGADVVDVIVGGEYGSEGKGHIASYVAPEYDLLVRVGGPNAGHKVYEEPNVYTHHHLPSGTRFCQAKLLIGPGATIHVRDLMKEIGECNVEADRLFIDPNAMVISDDDIKAEKKGVSAIGSTGQGVGAAMARRILGRFEKPHPFLAKDSNELKPFLRSAIDVMDEAYQNGYKTLLEGTQGTGLSLYHGYYPHVTSRDTTVAGCLAEAGIAWNRIRRSILVCRTYPIRVQSPTKSTSGPMSLQISWAEISRRSHIPVDQLRRAERTSTTNRQRRVGEFDWTLLHKSALINGTTDIALTFVDYLSEKNRQAKRFDQIDKETINFIQEIEKVAGARVSLISTGFGHRTIIDRRLW